MGSETKRLFWRLALWGASLAIIFQVAPGEPEWMDSLDLPSSDQQSSNLEGLRPPSVHVFEGGDGTTMLIGRLYRPLKNEHEDGPPLIVLAHGLGLTQDSGLSPFVQSFVKAGYAAFTFDYATFGWSAGWPRHQIKPQRHVEDLKAALSYIRNTTHNLQQVVNVNKIGLWGTSLGGGHVLSVAASDSDIRVVVANVPHVRSAVESILGTIQRDPLVASVGLVKVLGALIKYGLNLLFYETPTYIPIHGPPASAAMLQNPGDDEGYGGLIEEPARKLGWRNLASVGGLLPMLVYRPMNTVTNITAPTLFIAAQHDTLCPAADSKTAFHRMNPKTTKLVTLPNATHFGVYQGEILERCLTETVDFFRTHFDSS